MEYRRSRIPGAIYFFTLVTQDRAPLLTHPRNLERLREAMRRERDRHPFQVVAIVVLPDHLHCLWQLPEGDADFSGRWSRIKRYVSTAAASFDRDRRAHAMVARREAGFWQRRFWEHRIRDETDLDRHLDYIHFNPVKHGLVTRVADWPHSSFKRCVARGWYHGDWGSNEPPAIHGMHPE